MARADKATIMAGLTSSIAAAPDPEGIADLVAKQGRINVAADPADMEARVVAMEAVMGPVAVEVET